MKSRIIAFHLLNDFSGSPKVLAQLAHIWAQNGYDVQICTNRQQGFLSGIPSVTYQPVHYTFAANPWLRLLHYGFAQFLAFVLAVRLVRQTDTVYINTILPFGAALGAYFKKARIVYHIHESAIKPPVLNAFLRSIMRFTATEVVFVSQYLAQQYAIKRTTHVLYNAIPEAFLQNRLPKAPIERPQNVLMLCSLKAYKGIHEFVNLAQHFGQYRFKLVLNASAESVEAYFKPLSVPPNVQLYAAQPDVHPFYAWADVVLNLSRPDSWVETFGLTIVEAMAYGLPVIVPPVGGITEVIEEAKTGFKVNCRNTSLLHLVFGNLMGNLFNYQMLSVNALARVAHFKEEAFAAKSLAIMAGGDFSEKR